MLEKLLGSGSEFDSGKSLLRRWLRGCLEVKVLRVLTSSDLEVYKGHRFVAGWNIAVEHKGTLYRFDVLIDGQFPYSQIRVAFKSSVVYLKWPHVEAEGLLCLSKAPSPATGVEDSISDTLLDALELVESCNDSRFLDYEFRREFLSYWSRSIPDKSKTIQSLLDPTNRRTRQIAVWQGKTITLVGETKEQVLSWLRGMGRKDSVIISGVFGFLDQAPVSPFPDSVEELDVLLQSQGASALKLYEKLPIEKDVTLVLGADSPTGVGLFAITITKPNLNGYRKNNLKISAKKFLWAQRGRYMRVAVERFDTAWVHGRGMNDQLSKLESATVLVLGCGSLGSQVAVRLAQSGVGNLILVDPDKLSAANVGRHALGIGSVGKSKVTELANEIKRRFPHIQSVEGSSLGWQMHFQNYPEKSKKADLVVACMGEWSADGQFGEWQVSQRFTKPVVYGWLDEKGTAAHAISLVGGLPALSCVLDLSGQLREPETLWESDGLTQAEPACGTLFQPYGSIDVAIAEALVSRLCIDVLSGKTIRPVHRVYACSTAQLSEAGGQWSHEHLKARPKDFEGAFEYEHSVLACGLCKICLERI